MLTAAPLPPLGGAGLVPRRAAKVLLGRQVDPPYVKFGGKASRPLVEEERELTVHQEVVVDGGQACAKLQLGSFVPQVHGGSQGQVVIPSRIVGVLWHPDKSTK